MFTQRVLLHQAVLSLKQTYPKMFKETAPTSAKMVAPTRYMAQCYSPESYVLTSLMAARQNKSINMMLWMARYMTEAQRLNQPNTRKCELLTQRKPTTNPSTNRYLPQKQPSLTTIASLFLRRVISNNKANSNSKASETLKAKDCPKHPKLYLIYHTSEGRIPKGNSATMQNMLRTLSIWVGTEREKVSVSQRSTRARSMTILLFSTRPSTFASLNSIPDSNRRSRSKTRQNSPTSVFENYTYQNYLSALRMKTLLVGLVLVIGIKCKQVSSPKIKIRQHKPPKLGGYNEIDTRKAERVLEFLREVVPDSSGMKLTNYRRQVVRGWNHLLTFQLNHRQKREIIVYENIDNEFRLASDETSAQETL